MNRSRIIAADEAFLYNQGNYFHAYNSLGAHRMEIDGQAGWGFVVWAPGAINVWLVGDFNGWQSEGFAMQPLPGGFWQLFTTAPKLRSEEHTSELQSPWYIGQQAG